MSKFVVLLIAFVAVDCQSNNNSTIVLGNEGLGTANATKIVMEFVRGMGRALQQLLTANSNQKPQTPQMIAVDLNSTEKQENYRMEGERLREEIVKRVNSLQTVIGTAIQVARDRRDVISKRILEQANNRLQSAKDRADKVLREPSNSEIAVRTLRTINSGISHLSTFVNSLLGRVNISIKVDVKEKPENDIPKKQ